ncbi:sensor histidine kinase [Geofilum rubicundum JCM 15548]|uniref:histidine kinase n=2 Tax=Geofilum TaxID=1236988 RepID=A0A0E9LTQ3_9BACT|nr:sensor histidine kinase [Geofilum rubicundum JCM 15548]
MAQDQDGYIWIGTQDGLNRFDGQDVKAYKTFNGGSEMGLIGNQIDHLVVDHHNRIWISTPYGISVYNPRKDFFEVVASEQALKGLGSVYLNFMQVDDQGALVVGSSDFIYRFEEATQSFVPVIQSPFGFISSLLIDADNNWWLGHFEGGGVTHYPDIRDTTSYQRFVEAFQPEEADFMVMDMTMAEGYIWMAIEESGLARLDTSTKEIEIFFGGGGERFFFDLYTDRDNRLWTCDYSGLKMYQSATEQFASYYHDPQVPHSLPNNLNGVFQDQQGNIYTFHNGDGVHLSTMPRGFQTYNTSDRFYWHTTNQNISSVHEDAKGQLWLGSFNGGLDVFLWEDQRMVHYPSRDNDTPESLGRGSVLSLYRDSRQQMWVGTHAGGLHLFDEAAGKFQSWRKSFNKPSISHNDVRSISEDSLGNLWLGLHGGGVDHFDQTTGMFTNYNEKNAGLTSDWVHDVLIDSRGRLWAGTAYGLNHLDPGSTRFDHYMAQFGREGALQGNQIICLFEDSQNRLWIGTNNGLYLYDDSSDSFVRYDSEANNNFIAAIEEDQNGFIWFSTMGGLYRLEVSTKHLFRFDEEDGLQGLGFNLRASYFNGKEILFFAGSKGVNSFNPEKLVFNEVPPVVRFSRFKLFNEPIVHYGEGSVLAGEINTVDEITLAYDQNFFTFDFIALNFINPERNQYACQMEGFDDDWVYLGKDRSASYTNLNPGRYTFRVKAANNDGVWNEEGISIDIRILPPWWFSIWFLTSFLVVLVLLVYGIFRLRTARLRRQKRLLLSQVSDQTARLRNSNKILKDRAEELDRVNQVLEERQRLIVEQAEELESQAENLQKSNQELVKHIKTKDKLFSIIAHDLRAPFNTIMGFSSLLTEISEEDDKEQVKSYARYVNDASLLVFNLLENLLYWARSQTNEIQFVPGVFQLQEVIKDNVGLVRETAIKKEIRIDDRDCKNFEVFGDENMMRTVLRNLIINAVKFTPRGGVVTVTTKAHKDGVEVCVADTGTGMSETDIEKILHSGAGYSQKGTDGEKGSGLGLVLCQEFIVRNGGHLHVTSKLGEGSSFCFTIPRPD